MCKQLYVICHRWAQEQYSTWVLTLKTADFTKLKANYNLAMYLQIIQNNNTPTFTTYTDKMAISYGKMAELLTLIYDWGIQGIVKFTENSKKLI